MEKAASLVIIIGVLLWVASILIFKGLWRFQMLSAGVIIFGIILAHTWEELFRNEDDWPSYYYLMEEEFGKETGNSGWRMAGVG